MSEDDLPAATSESAEGLRHDGSATGGAERLHGDDTAAITEARHPLTGVGRVDDVGLAAVDDHVALDQPVNPRASTAAPS